MCTGLPVKINDNLIFARTMEFGASMQSVLRYTPKRTDFTARLQLDEASTVKSGKTWTSKYGIFGPTAMGTDHLIEGINEKGLHVAGFYFPDFAKYQHWPTNASETSNCIGPMDVIEYILGTCENVDQACDALQGVRVSDCYMSVLNQTPPLHWIVQESNGKAKVVEYLDHELKIFDNPLNVITNSPDFPWHMTNLQNYVNLSYNNAEPLELTGHVVNPLGQGSGMLGLPGDFTPPSRFIRAVALSQSVALPGASRSPHTMKGGVNLTWNLIDNVTIPSGAARDPGVEDDYTQWVSVSDLAGLKYYFRTYDNQNIRVVDVAQLMKDESCVVEVSMHQEVEYQDITPQ